MPPSAPPTMPAPWFERSSRGSRHQPIGSSAAGSVSLPYWLLPTPYCLDLPMLDLKALVRSIPDYPKPGILFRDITTLIENPEGFRESIERIAEHHRGLGITHVAGIEARGFIFG